MEIIEATLLLRPGRGRMTDLSKVLAGLAGRRRANARDHGTGQAVDCRIDRRRHDDAAAREMGDPRRLLPWRGARIQPAALPRVNESPGTGPGFLPPHFTAKQ
jgi:hypothetical protein